MLDGKSMMLFNVQAQLSTDSGGGGRLGGDRGERNQVKPISTSCPCVIQ